MASPYIFVANAPAFAEQCEAFVEQQLLGHTGVYASPLAATAAADFVRTSCASCIPSGVAVVFGAAPSNDGLGHSGVSIGGGQMRSVWSNGAEEQEAIAQFVTDNGAPLLGYHRFGLGVPPAPSGGAALSQVPANVQGAASGVLGALAAHPKAVAWGVVGALVFWLW